MVAAPLLLVFVVCAVLVTVAVRGGDDVVSDDYYKEGKMVNKRFAAESYAEEKGISGVLTLFAEEGYLDLTLTEPLDSSDKLELRLSHPAEADFDQAYVLKRKSIRGYYADLLSVPEGRWYVRVEGFSSEGNKLLWRLSGEIDFNQSPRLQLQ